MWIQCLQVEAATTAHPCPEALPRAFVILSPASMLPTVPVPLTPLPPAVLTSPERALNGTERAAVAAEVSSLTCQNSSTVVFNCGVKSALRQEILVVSAPPPAASVWVFCIVHPAGRAFE